MLERRSFDMAPSKADRVTGRGSLDIPRSSPTLRSRWSAKRGSQDSSSSSSHRAEETESPLRQEYSNNSDVPTIATMSTMNDPRWMDFVERSSMIGAAELNLGLAATRPRVNTIPNSLQVPDISRLRSNSHNNTMTRPSLESLGLSAGALPKVHQMLSRRSLKTPGLRSSHLQKSKSQEQHPVKVVKKRASVELIAEQYRAMLDYRDRLEEGFVYDEAEAKLAPPVKEPMGVVEPEPEPQPPIELPLLEPNTYHEPSFPTVRWDKPRAASNDETSTVHAPRQVDLANLSPQSDGTLVGFEEDVIYFKPLSFGPSPPASPGLPEIRRTSVEVEREHRQREKARKHSHRQLDIGIDLLSSELSSSLARRRTSRRQSDERVADLQLSVMIDAYENLRERTKAMDLGEDDRENMSDMFESWLSTLRKVRGNLGDAAQDRSGRPF